MYSRRYGGLISIKNLPLDYWNIQTFETFGVYFWGLLDISLEILNFVNVSEAKIQVKEKRGNIFLNFGDISVVNPPSKIKGDVFSYDF